MSSEENQARIKETWEHPAGTGERSKDGNYDDAIAYHIEVLNQETDNIQTLGIRSTVWTQKANTTKILRHKMLKTRSKVQLAY